MPSVRVLIAGSLLAGLLAPTLACASVLYRCDSSDGSIAYVSSPKGFRNCKVVATFPDTPPPAPAAPATQRPQPAVAEKPAPPGGSAIASGWAYEERKADFSNVRAGVSAAPAGTLLADFDNVEAGVASTARMYAPPDFSNVRAAVASTAALVTLHDFSTVLAGVATTARQTERPLFIAAPYRGAGAPVETAPRRRGRSTAASVAPGPRVVRGSVYKVVHANGIVEYTNVRPARGRSFAVLFTYIATCIACDVHSGIDFAHTRLNLDAYRDIVAAAAAEFGVDRALLRAVIHAESAFNPLAISRKGAQGLMQLMPATAGALGVTDAFDEEQNIRGGARYLSELLRSFNGDARLATAAYNAGPGAVQKYGGVPPYDETRLYVERVATLRDRYEKAL